jgi:hypothetical protein
MFLLMQYVCAIRMEKWDAGILGVTAETNHFNCKQLLETHHSITPSFQLGLPLVPCNGRRGQAPKFSHIFSASFKICDVISESVVSILNPAAMAWPPPPKEAAIEATSTVPSERRLT